MMENDGASLGAEPFGANRTPYLKLGPEGKWFSQRAEEQNGCKMVFRNQKQNLGAKFR
jgi:hypothetical protein